MTDRHMVIKTLLMQNMGSAHYLPVLHNAIQAHVISLRPQRCCHHAFAAHMPVRLLNEFIFRVTDLRQGETEKQ